MKNSQKGFIAPLLIVIIAVLVIGSGVYVYNQDKNIMVDENTSLDVNSTSTNNENSSNQFTVPDSTTDRNTKVKTYSNSKYGFQFNYPASFITHEYPRNGEQECKDDPNIVNDGKRAYVVSIDSVMFDVVCEGLTNEIGNKYLNYPQGEEYEKITKITVAGKESYRHTYVTATGYSWVVIQIPIDSSHYLEISESNGNADRIRGDMPLTSIEWDIILSSLKITK